MGSENLTYSIQHSTGPSACRKWGCSFSLWGPSFILCPPILSSTPPSSGMLYTWSQYTWSQPGPVPQPPCTASRGICGRLPALGTSQGLCPPALPLVHLATTCHTADPTTPPASRATVHHNADPAMPLTPPCHEPPHN